jgi:hypothetical protein
MYVKGCPGYTKYVSRYSSTEVPRYLRNRGQCHQGDLLVLRSGLGYVPSASGTVSKGYATLLHVMICGIVW